MEDGPPVDHVLADSSVQTGLTGTLINIHLAVHAAEAGLALTQVHAHQVLAGGSIPAGVGLTLVYFGLAVDSCEEELDMVRTQINI